jgi:phosphoglycolate phosphatase
MAIADLGIRGARTGAMAGDGPRDVQAAHNAGLDGIHVARHDHPAGAEAATLDGATRVRTLTDLWD